MVASNRVQLAISQKIIAKKITVQVPCLCCGRLMPEVEGYTCRSCSGRYA